MRLTLLATVGLSLLSSELIAQQRINTPGGVLEMSRWAEQPMLQDPVALSFDTNGDLYVVETARRGTVDIDIRSHMPWILDDLANQSVEQLRSFFRQKMSPELSLTNHEWLQDRNNDGLHDWRDLTMVKETLRRLRDTDGDGKADQSTVFADGFNEEFNGVVAGVLPVQGSVLMTIYPDLWKLRDTNDDGIADQREIMFRGFGVHAALDGHDLHGLTVGPEGKIYFSVGDNGFSVTTLEGNLLHHPNTGGVLRMNPDGTDLEVFSYGTRNIQEIAFNEYGDLFSVDNDGDIQDERERFVYLVEGGDSGWRLNWQFQTEGWATFTGGPGYNPWIEERLWVPHFPDQAAYIFPPISNYSVGPGGFKYNPGTALNDYYRRYFFLCQFPVQKITAFRAEEAGASYRMADEHVFHSGLMASALNFGPDGAMYIADWVGKWQPNNEGVIYRVDDPSIKSTEIRKQVRRIIQDGLANSSIDELIQLLGHADQRVRQRSQFELVDRNDSESLIATVENLQAPQLARVHALWGLVQVATVAKRKLDLESIAERLPWSDADPEIRGQVAKAVGDLAIRNQTNQLLKHLSDDATRVRYRAAIALGKVGNTDCVKPLFELLEANADQDTAIRHAATMGLVGSATSDDLVSAWNHPSRFVRSAAVVAMRRGKDPEVVKFLVDKDLWIAKEAALAIHDDFSISEAIPDLANRLNEKMQPHAESEAIVRRMISACVRVGTELTANHLLQFVLDDARPETLRVEALYSLAQWNQNPMYDRVDGRIRQLPDGRADIGSIVEGQLPSLFKKATANMELALITLTDRLDLNPGADIYANWVADPQKPIELRIKALQALSAKSSGQLSRSITTALRDKHVSLRKSGLQALATIDPEMAIQHIQNEWLEFAVDEKQAAIKLLGQSGDAEADHMLVTYLERAMKDQWPRELQLDLELATSEKNHQTIQDLLKQLKSKTSDAQSIDANTSLLFGGDAKLGESIYRNHVTAQCVRCHEAGGEGKQAGPVLKGIGKRENQEYLLEAILFPSKTIAKGFDATQITTTDGLQLTGVVISSDEQQTVLVDNLGKRHIVSNDDIEDQNKARVSSMPTMDSVLTKREIRDLVEFLSTY